LFGERELSNNPAFHGLLEEVQRVTGHLGNFEMAIVPSADHFYAGVHDRATAAMTDWLQQKFASSASRTDV